LLFKPDTGKDANKAKNYVAPSAIAGREF